MCVYFSADQPGVIIRLGLIALVYVKPARAYDFMSPLLRFLSLYIRINVHLFEELHVKLSCCNCSALMQLVSNGVSIKLNILI